MRKDPIVVIDIRRQAV